jgi:hypothetical protein
MPYARVIPIPPGKTAACKRMVAEMLGPRKDDFEKALIGEGITEQHFWIQSGPKGDFLIIYNDGDAILRERILEVRRTSQEPFDVWYREQLSTVLNVDMNQRAPGSRFEEIGGWVADQTRRDQAEVERSHGTPIVRPQSDR